MPEIPASSGNAPSSRQEFNGYYAGFWGGWAFRWLDRSKIALLRRVLRQRPRAARLLDLGCGSGRVTTGLGLGPDRSRLLVVGLDHDRALLRLARARGSSPVLADLERPLPFADGAFDVVVIVDAIEHVEDPRCAVAQAIRVLSPGGSMVVFTPPYDSVVWVLAEKAHRVVTGRNADHISPFTSESLGFLLSRHFREWKVGTLNGGLTMYGVASGACRAPASTPGRSPSVAFDGRVGPPGV